MSDITYRLVKGTELTFGELDRNFGSLDSDIISLQSQVDSLAVAAGLDSGRTINIITDTVDSAYVELMYSKIDIFRDSLFVENIVDSPYVNARVDLAALGAADSSTIISLIDSALDSVGPFYTTIDHDSDTLVQVDSAYVRHRADSGYITGIIDSDYIKFRADSDYIKTAADSQYVTRIAQDVAGLDSAKLIRFLDSETRHVIPLDGETYDLGTNLKRWRALYVKDLFVSPATIYFSDSAETPQSTISLDSDGEFKLTSPTQTGYINTSSVPAATGPSLIAGGRIRTTAGGAWAQNFTTQKQLFGIWDSGQGPGGTDGIDRLSAGLYKFQFDSTNLARITSGDDYTVMVAHDYGRDDPTASSRTVSVYAQEDSSFQILLERGDTGDNENYSDDAHINFQVWLY
jgi:hypothetical protein